MRTRHRLSTLAAVLTAAAATAALTVGPALADPPPGVTPKATDVVGVGADTTQYLLDQISVAYNKTVASSAPHLYSFDATGTSTIATKSGSSACAIPRPNGSSAGIAALEANATDGSNFCVDFARSSRSRNSTDPACAAGGLCFIYLAADGVDWTARSKAAGGTDAPASLTVAQLKAIYLCQDTNWSQVGGKNATIQPYLPQTSSGIRTVFLTALGGGTPIVPGACVSDGATSQFPNGTIQQNEGQDPLLNSAQAIFPYSVANYIAQGYHSAACTSGCGGTVSDNPVCKPAGSENLFGCNETGGTPAAGAAVTPILTLMKIQGTAPTAPYPLPAEPVPPKINTTIKLSQKFDSAFLNDVNDVVRYGGSSTNIIPSYLKPLFDPTGYICSSTAAKTAIKNYGFLALPTTSTTPCGTPLNGTG